MRTSNGQCVCPENFNANTLLSPSQIEFINYIMFHGVGELSKSLKLIHDLALYYSDVSLDKEEKSALLDLKILWEFFQRMDQES